MSLVAATRALSPQSVPSRGLTAAATRRQRPVLPDPMDLARWRQKAEAQLEGALAELDHRLLRGEHAGEVLEQVVDTYMLWSRRSVAQFTSDIGTIGGAPSPEVRHWEGVADQVIGDEQPELVERFLRIWLAVIHEGAASGRATLYALTPG
jgi:hypothetical protein